MDQEKDKINYQIHALTMGELKGKQSVRATFRLPQQVIDLISVIAGQLGIKQKSLFDQLVEDVTVLNQMATEAKGYLSSEKKRRQKTFVISRNSLIALDYIAKEQQVPRDVLVEVSIRRLLPVIEAELEKHEKRKILLKELNDYLAQGEKLEKNARYYLGEEDVFFRMIEHQVSNCRKSVAALFSLVEKGKAMESW
jgi:hypothetical protein